MQKRLDLAIDFQLGKRCCRQSAFPLLGAKEKDVPC